MAIAPTLSRRVPQAREFEEVRTLVSNTSSETARVTAARALGFEPTDVLRVANLRAIRPTMHTDDQALGAFRAQTAGTVPARVQGGRITAIVHDDASNLTTGRPPVRWVVAVGPAVRVPFAHESAGGAALTSRFAPRCFGPRVLRHDDLGPLVTLATVPAPAAAACDHVKRLEQHARGPAGLEDLRTLEVYLRTGNLRSAASELFAHHSTVARRVDRCFTAMDLSVTHPPHRVIAHIGLCLWILTSPYTSE